MVTLHIFQIQGGTSPEQNIEGGARYLSELLKMFGGLEVPRHTEWPGVTGRVSAP